MTQFKELGLGIGNNGSAIELIKPRSPSTPYYGILQNPNTSFEEQAKAYWKLSSSSPKHLETGITTLVNAIQNENGNNGNSTARKLLENLITQEIPAFLMQSGSQKESDIYFRAHLAQTLAFCLLQHETAMPKEAAMNLLNEITWKSDPEGQIPILMAISTKTAQTMLFPRITLKVRNSSITVMSITGLNKINENNGHPPSQQLKSPIETHAQRVNSKLSTLAATLKKAAKQNEFTESNLRLASIAIGRHHNELTGEEKPSQAVNELQKYAVLFLNAFIHRFAKPKKCSKGINIITNAISKAPPYVSDLLTGLLTHRFYVHRETAYGEYEDLSLEPLLLVLLNTYAENPSDDIKSKIDRLVEKTSSQGKKGTFMVVSPLISQIVSQNRLPERDQLTIERSFISYLKKFGFEIEELPGEELLDFMRGKKTISFGGDRGTEIFLHDIDREPNTGRLIGYYKDRQKEPTKPPQPAAALTKPVTVFEESPAPTPEPELTKEEKIAHALQEAFGDEPNQEELIQIKEEHEGLWSTIYGPHAKRDKYFSPKGDVARLSLSRNSPRVVLHGTMANGLASDIAADIYIDELLTVRIILDIYGYPLEPFQTMYLEGKLSYGRMLQVGKRIASLAAFVFIRDEDKMAARVARSYKHAKKEVVGPDGSIIKEKLLQVGEESKKYLVEKVSEETGEVKEYIIDEEAIRRGLEAAEESQMLFQLPEEKNGKKGNKGKVIDDPITAFRVLLPPGYTASEEARKNAKRFGIPLPVFRVYSIDPESGLLVHGEKDIYTTARSVRRKQLDI